MKNNETTKPRNRFTPEEMVLCSDHELLRSGNYDLEEIKKRKIYYSKKFLPKLKSAFDLDLEKSTRISTGCKKLDNFFNGGLMRGCITEIYGESSSGKTQIALQTTINAWKTGAVYLCTEDAFPSKRLNQMIHYLAKSQNKEKNNHSEYGDKIFVLQIKEVEELIKCIDVQLDRLLRLHPSISVIVLDSVAAPFRGNYNEANAYADRSILLKNVGMGLLKHAKTYNLAVLCINQVSSNLNSQESNNLMPCLGLVWSNMVTTRIHVSKTKFYKNENVTTDGCVHNSEDENVSINTKTNIREMRVKFSSDLTDNESHNYIITSSGVIGQE